MVLTSIKIFAINDGISRFIIFLCVPLPPRIILLSMAVVGVFFFAASGRAAVCAAQLNSLMSISRVNF